MWNATAIGVAALSFFAIGGSPAFAQEKLVGTYGEVRTVLSYKVSDAALQKFIPGGWQSNPAATGPYAGANVHINLIDQVSVQDSEGKPQRGLQIAALVFPGKKVGTDTTGAMVFGGLASDSSNVPGAYGNFELAKATVERKRLVAPEGKSSTQESWNFKTDDGDSISIQLEYAPASTVRTKVEPRVYSAKNSDFYRIYRIEQALDLVQSTATGTDRVQKAAVKVTGSKYGQLFDGTEKLVVVASIPWYTRQVFLPSGGTQ